MGNGNSVRRHHKQRLCVPDCCFAPNARRMARQLRQLNETGILFEQLEGLFTVGLKCQITVKGHNVGGIVREKYYTSTCSGDAFVVILGCLSAAGDHIREKTTDVYIGRYRCSCTFACIARIELWGTSVRRQVPRPQTTGRARRAALHG